jgi:integrase
LLSRIPKRATTVLTNGRGRPWKELPFNYYKNAAGMKGRNLHFHDLRGTACTRFYAAGLDERDVAEIMGWEEAHVAKIIRRYVGRGAATKAMIRKLNQANKRRT